MSDTIQALTEAVRGRVITASDSDYDDARVVYNDMHDRKPGAVIQCMDSADVMAAVAAGRDSGPRLAVRGGGGRGLIVGIECVSPARSREACEASLRRGVILLPSGEGGGVLSITPPLSIEGELLQHALGLVADSLS